MISINLNNTTLSKYKDIIDFIYEATVKPEGYTGALCAFGTRYGYVAAEMVARGVLAKTGTKMKPVYKWTPAMCPTESFYESVASACVMKERDMSARSFAKKAALKKKTQSIDENVTQHNNDIPVVVNGSVDKKECCAGIDKYTDSELWEELKRRGCYIADGKLAKKVVFYFE